MTPLRENFPEAPRENFPKAPRENFPKVPRENFPEAPRENFPEAPRENFPEAPRENFPKAPRENFPKAPRENFPKAPRENFPKAPRENFPEAPRENFPKAPRENFPKAPRENFPEAPRFQCLLKFETLSLLGKDNNVAFQFSFLPPFCFGDDGDPGPRSIRKSAASLISFSASNISDAASKAVSVFSLTPQLHFISTPFLCDASHFADCFLVASHNSPFPAFSQAESAV